MIVVRPGRSQVWLEAVNKQPRFLTPKLWMLHCGRFSDPAHILRRQVWPPGAAHMQPGALIPMLLMLGLTGSCLTAVMSRHLQISRGQGCQYAAQKPDPMPAMLRSGTFQTPPTSSGDRSGPGLPTCRAIPMVPWRLTSLSSTLTSNVWFPEPR